MGRYVAPQHESVNQICVSSYYSGFSRRFDASQQDNFDVALQHRPLGRVRTIVDTPTVRALLSGLGNRGIFPAFSVPFRDLEKARMKKVSAQVFAVLTRMAPAASVLVGSVALTVALGAVA